MAQIIIKQSQLNLIKETIQLESKWAELTTDEKEFVVESLKILYPEKSKLIKEAKWYNTIGDIAGIFDPLGVIDLANGISYWNQGDKFFAFLSLVSALPYLGDVVAKPVMEALKIGSPALKELKVIMNSSKEIKSAEEAAKISERLAKISTKGGIAGKFVEGMGRIGNKFQSFIERIPAGPFKGLKNTILEWIELFKQGAAKGVRGRTAIGNLSKEFEALSKTFSAAEKTKLASELAKEVNLIKKEKGLFTGYGTANKLFSHKTLIGGVPQILGRNKSVRYLMRKTRFWAKFLGYLGINKLIGVDELSQSLGGDEQMAQKLEQYGNTPEGQKETQELFGNLQNQSTEQTPQQNQQQNQQSDATGFDPLGSVLGSLFI